MLILVSGASATVAGLDSPYLGRLTGPRCRTAVGDDRPWAADNDAFSGFHAARFLTMLTHLPPGSLWVTCPDVVSDHNATLIRWHEWAPVIRGHGHCPAFVLQNGCERLGDAPSGVPLFIGGDTEYKLSATVATITGEARALGLPVHMGRVNTRCRVRYAHKIGCTSFDGTGFSMFPRTHIPWALDLLAELGAVRAQTEMF